MADKILMPRLSDTMTEGVIAAWHKKVGDTVKKGDLLAEIETDKATMELESYKDGTVLYLGVEKGGKLKVDDLMVIVGNPGEDISGMIGETSVPAITAEKHEPQPAATKENKPAAGSALDISGIEEVVLMPRLSDTMTEGVIASWGKNVGDDIKKGDLLAEIETDKATMELESYKNGKLLYQGAKKGEKVKVNDLLCIIGEEGKVDVDAIVSAAKNQSAGSSEAAATPVQEAVAEAPIAKVETPATAASSSIENGRIKASPLAKKLAAEKGINLSNVQGSGDGGRI
ncbi:MAG TPA: E3 binding domain-containing protein, partial [Niabella sp.]|nr:E3 binding domain-containing protein [Niabella sp.]